MDFPHYAIVGVAAILALMLQYGLLRMAYQAGRDVERLRCGLRGCANTTLPSRTETEAGQQDGSTSH